MRRYIGPLIWRLSALFAVVWGVTSYSRSLPLGIACVCAVWLLMPAMEV